ncbi:MAG: hypothetical protein IJU60_01050 [Acholeplasmatales bacterium]|nr:hypothetical protein [Acholeplasmatales bacterium]
MFKKIFLILIFILTLVSCNPSGVVIYVPGANIKTSDYNLKYESLVFEDELVTVNLVLDIYNMDDYSKFYKAEVSYKPTKDGTYINVIQPIEIIFNGNLMNTDEEFISFPDKYTKITLKYPVQVKDKSMNFKFGKDIVKLELTLKYTK